MNSPLPIMLGVALMTLASVVFAAGDAERGEALYGSRCVACHSVDQSRVGPPQRGVFGRRAGRVDGYDYSPALKASKIVWAEKALDAWLANPERTIPGQKMGFSVTDKTDRTDLISYLRKVSLP